VDEHGRLVCDIRSVDHVADLLDELCAANGVLGNEAWLIAQRVGGGTPVGIDRLSRLSDPTRPGARACAQLCAVTPSRMLAGTRVWLARNRAASA
jgi:hypothetical protein